MTTEQASAIEPDAMGATFPPDSVFSESLGVSFKQLSILAILFGAAVDLGINGIIDSPVPYNYHTIGAFVHTIVAVIILERTYYLGVELMDELAELADQDRGPLALETTDVTGEEIRADFSTALSRGFHPYVLLGGAVVSVATGLIGAALLDLFGLIPYWIVGITFFAAHGLYLGPLVVGVYLLYQTINKYIVNIDVLSPDGVGGYRTVGDAIVSIATYAIVLLTLDFVVASAVSFFNRTGLKTIILGVYGILLIVVTGLIITGVLGVRGRLLEIRDAKVERLRAQFTETEQEYWRKQKEGGDISEEALDMMTKRSMFQELSSMSLWPINIAALAKLGFSTGSSLFIFALDRGLIVLPL